MIPQLPAYTRFPTFLEPVASVAWPPPTADQVIRFSAQRKSKPETTIIGGMPMDAKLIRQLGRGIESKVYRLGQRYFNDEEPTHTRFPGYYQAILESFCLDRLWGIPPNLRKIVPYKGKTIPHVRPQTTHALTATLALDIVRQLPNACSLEEAWLHLSKAIDEINLRADFEAKVVLMEKVAESQVRDWKDPMPVAGTRGIKPLGEDITALRGTMIGSVLTGHLLFIGKNGAIQVVTMPKPADVIDMLRHDDQAQRSLLQEQPLDYPSWMLDKVSRDMGLEATGLTFKDFLVSQLDPPEELIKVDDEDKGVRFSPDAVLMLRQGKRFETIEDAYAFLQELQDGKHPKRFTQEGATDITYLLSRVKFDFQKHIREGRLKTCMVDKPGQDGNHIADLPLVDLTA